MGFNERFVTLQIDDDFHFRISFRYNGNPIGTSLDFRTRHFHSPAGFPDHVGNFFIVSRHHDFGENAAAAGILVSPLDHGFSLNFQ